jgi:ABC-type transport system substrate-binding protein
MRGLRRSTGSRPDDKTVKFTLKEPYAPFPAVERLVTGGLADPVETIESGQVQRDLGDGP